jgi:LuxR family maltose regulon positive regulatory protein
VARAPGGRIGEVVLLEAWAELAAGRHASARAIIEPLRSGAVRALLPHTSIEAHLIEAEVSIHAGDVSTGTAALDRAVQAGAKSGIVRPFVLAGPRTREVLASRPAARGTGCFAARLAASRKTIRADASALLSERELVVLALLPSLMSACEIAGELTVSVNTVKSHIRSIYAKLGASTRRDAVRHAHERGLLS